MEKITSVSGLRESILLLEIKQANEAQLLKEEFKATFEKMKPINLIKNSINEMVSSPNLKENILNAALGIAAGFISKKTVVGSTHNPLKQLLGLLIEVGVAGVVTKNADGIKSTVMTLISSLIAKKRKAE
jgi:hypothetical protein